MSAPDTVLQPAGAGPLAPRFSVVIPLFDKAAFVRTAVLSALHQTLPPLEVIVVDDGSTDAGLQALVDLQDTRLRRVRQVNAGVSAARNRGIRLARGDWVALLDADDAWHPGFLAALARALSHCPQADLLGTGFRRVQAWPAETTPPGDAAAREDEAPVEVISDLRRRWMRHAPLCSSSAAIRRARLQGMERWFREGESYGEDLDMWFRLADLAPVAVVDAPYATVRTAVAGSLSERGERERRGLPPFLVRMRAQALDGTSPKNLRVETVGDVLRRSGKKGLTSVQDVPRVGRVQTAHAVEEGRFARAIRANECDHLALRNLETHAVEGDHTTESHHNIADVEQWKRVICRDACGGHDIPRS